MTGRSTKRVGQKGLQTLVMAVAAAAAAGLDGIWVCVCVCVPRKWLSKLVDSSALADRCWGSYQEFPLCFFC